MTLIRYFIPLFCLLALAVPGHAASTSLERLTKRWQGDLSDILTSHRPIRVLVSYNRTNFFFVNGAMRGLEYDLMRAYEKYLSKTHPKARIRMTFVTVPFEQLIPALLDGRGDLIAAGMTVTKERRKLMRFSDPYRVGINEIVVASREAPPIETIADYAGKTFHVMAGSSYVAHLKQLNKRLKKLGLKPVVIEEADSRLVTEDLLEMAERNMIQYTVADSHVAEVWKTALPHLKLFGQKPVHAAGDLAWGVRSRSQELAQSLSDFAATVRGGTLLGNMIFRRYYVNSDWVKNPNAREDRKRLQKLQSVLEKYGVMYGFDWLKLAAIAYQESQLNMQAKSHAGAVGIMQVRPATAADPHINVQDIHSLDGNVHAGSKYLRFLRDRYFQDAPKSAQVDFALAAYNAGPARVTQLRKKAEDMGLDPNQWFGNVEWAAYRDIGTETPTYVANVQMYYAAYKSAYAVVSERKEAK